MIRHIIYNPGHYDAIRQGRQDNLSFFCKNCKIRNMCDRGQDKPRVLKINKKVIEMIHDNDYPYNGRMKRQPVWFSDLYKKYNEVYGVVMREKQRTEQQRLKKR